MSTDPTNSTSESDARDRRLDAFTTWFPETYHQVCKICHALVPSNEEHELAHLEWHRSVTPIESCTQMISSMLSEPCQCVLPPGHAGWHQCRHQINPHRS